MSKQVPALLKTTQILFFVNAVVWLIFSVLGFVRAANVQTALRWTYSVLMLVNAALMFWLGIQIVKKKAWIFFFAIAYITVNAVLSITDQFGWWDALILLLNLVLLGFLFAARQKIKGVEA